MSQRYFVFTWPDGSVKEGPGNTPEDAFTRLGFNKTTMSALDNYEEEIHAEVR